MNFWTDVGLSGNPDDRSHPVSSSTAGWKKPTKPSSKEQEVSVIMS